jgi:ribose transport system substrate-binding protein
VRCPRTLLVTALVLAAGLPARADEPVEPGLQTPVVLPDFDPAAATCTPPEGRDRVLAFARDNGRAFMAGVDLGLSRAAADRGLTYRAELAENDAERQRGQVEAMLADKVGAIVVAPVNSDEVAPILREVIGAGGYVGSIVPPPAVTILNAPQYLTGRVLGEAAAAHIRDVLGGRANVVLLTHDSLEFLAPRFTAMRDALRQLPGVTIVADISPQTVDSEGGYRMMQTILLAEPVVDVVLGADTVVLGALRAMRDAGKARSDQFFGGIDGEAEAVAELRDPESPFKSTVSLASPVFGYAMGQHAADWLEGRAIPQAMDVLPMALNAANLAAYEADMADPGAVWADPERRDAYLRMYGTICADTRDRFLDFPWSSESRADSGEGG